MINLNDLPAFDWRTVTSALLGAVLAWFGSLLQKKNK